MKCTACTYRAREWRLPFEQTLTFVFSPYSRCIQCGSYRVKRLRGRDRIDARSTHPLSFLLALTGAPFYHCNPCRLQYHDWRPVQPAEQEQARQVSV